MSLKGELLNTLHTDGVWWALYFAAAVVNNVVTFFVLGLLQGKFPRIFSIATCIIPKNFRLTEKGFVNQVSSTKCSLKHFF